MNKELANKLQSKLYKLNLKKKDFEIKVLEKRRYGDGTTFSWCVVNCRGKEYDIKDPYMGKRTTDVKNSILFSVVLQMERELKDVLNID